MYGADTGRRPTTTTEEGIYGARIAGPAVVNVRAHAKEQWPGEGVGTANGLHCD